MEKKSKVHKMLSQYFDEYITINLNGGWEKYCKTIEKYKADVNSLTYEQIANLRKKRKEELNKLCNTICD